MTPTMDDAMFDATLDLYGWNDEWAAKLTALGGDDHLPGRVVRHDGAGLIVATSTGIWAAPFQRRLDPAPTVGDWVALAGDEPVAILPRTSLLRRRAALADVEQVLAANIDVVLVVCGLDRPVKQGRIERSATLARDAGATPVIVLTKGALVPEATATADRVRGDNPGVEVLVTSVREEIGLDELRIRTAGHTVTLLGESGAGKSSLLNALLGTEAAAVGEVRAGDAKGRHTTTTRELHLLPEGGSLIDTPGIRAVGLWVETEAVTASFTDIDELAEQCRFSDCGHASEPDCAVTAAVAAGEVTAARVEAWRALTAEADRATTRPTPEQRKQEKQLARITKDAQRRKGR